MDVRAEVGSPFDQHDQQDPASYLQALVTTYPSLSSLLNHKISVELVCDSCKVVTNNTVEQLIMNIRIPIDSKSLKMDDLISLTQQYVVQDNELCDSCNVPMKLRTQIVDATQMIILKLDVWNKALDCAKTVRRNVSVTSAQNSSIKVGDKVFTLQSSVHLLSNKNAGLSYISIVRSNNKWIHCNNDVLSHECWPKGAKNLYLAFCEHSSSCSTKQRKFESQLPQYKLKRFHATTAVKPSKQNLPQVCKGDEGSCPKKMRVASTPLDVVDCEDWGSITLVEWPEVLRTEWRDSNR